MLLPISIEFRKVLIQETILQLKITIEKIHSKYHNGTGTAANGNTNSPKKSNSDDTIGKTGDGKSKGLGSGIGPIDLSEQKPDSEIMTKECLGSPIEPVFGKKKLKTQDYTITVSGIKSSLSQRHEEDSMSQDESKLL